MANRSLNKVMLIGNLTRDPELRYTPGGVPVCSFGLATNRSWTTQDGEQKEEAQFHYIVAWNRLAELCSQLLKKGRKVYVEGRLQYREWTGSDGNKQRRTEIVITDMMMLDSPRGDRRVEAELDKAAEYTSGGEAVTESVEAAESGAEPIGEPSGKVSETGEGEETKSETEAGQDGEGRVVSEEVIKGASEEVEGAKAEEPTEEAEESGESDREGSSEGKDDENDKKEKMPF